MIEVLAKDLRKPKYLHKIPNDKPGWYQWWASIKALELLLNSPYISKKYMADLFPLLHRREYKGDYYYCIYTGIATKGSIRSRLNWHVNQHHTETAVRSGTLSTLRQTISSLIAGNQYDEFATNELIDMLLVEYSAMNYQIKSAEAMSIIEQIEHDEQSKYILPLNIKGNYHTAIQPFLQELREVRKRSK